MRSKVSKILSIENLLIGITLFIPFSKGLVSIFLILLLLKWGITLKSNLTQFKKNLPLILLLSSIYFIECLGIINNDNDMKLGLSRVQAQFPILALAIIILGSRIEVVTIKRVYRTFVISILSATLYCLLHATIELIKGDSSYFFYLKLTSPLEFHAVEFSMYILLSIAILYKERAFLGNKILIAFILFLTIFLILSSIRIGLFTLLVLTSIIVIYKTIKSKKHKLIVYYFLVITIIIVAVSNIPQIKNRFTKLTTKSTNSVNLNGATGRLLMWEMANDIIKDNWVFGVGTGDDIKLLVDKYKTNKILKGAAWRKYNIHNQYLHFLLNNGVIQLLLYLIILASSLFLSVKRRSFILFCFVIIITIAGITEVFLCVHKGIIFYSLFLPLSLVGSTKLNNER